MLLASELIVATQSLGYVMYPGSYNSTKYSIGSGFIAKSGSLPTDNWIGPIPIGMTRPMEASIPVPCVFPWATQVVTSSVGNAGKDWVFLADGFTTTATRRIVMYEYDRNISEFTWKGLVILNFPTASTHVTRAFRMSRYLYVTGTVSALGTTVNGVNSQWVTDGQSGGSRIGFGSTDPNNITSWYDISHIVNDTLLILTQSAGTVSSGSSYVIDELRAYTLTTNASVANGGLYITKGLNYSTFTPGGTVIPSSGSRDSIRSTYWLQETPSASQSEVTTSAGLALEPMVSWQEHNAWVLSGGGTTGGKLFKFNLRTPLTGSLGSTYIGSALGRTTASFVMSTSLQIPVLTGNISQTNNGRYAVISHGILSGSPAFYFVTATRVYAAPLNTITTGSTNWATYAMVEIPPGSTTAFPAAGVFSNLEYSEKIDKFIITSTGGTSNRNYVTEYKTTPAQMENIFSCDIKQQDQSTAPLPSIMPPVITNNVLPFTVWTEGGIWYFVRGNPGTATTAVFNQLYAIPMSVHYEYTNISNEVLITPSISTPSATKYYRVYVNTPRQYGSDRFGYPPDPIRVSVRTAGILDNSGAWTQVDDAGTLSGISPASSIQFKIEFKSIGLLGLINRFYGLTVTYEAGGYLPSQLQWRLSDSNTTDGTIGFSQVSLFGSVPTLQIDYYRSDNQANVLTQQSTSTTYGVFEYWTGAAWTSGVGTNTVGLRRRFRPTAGLPTGVDVYAKVSVV